MPDTSTAAPLTMQERRGFIESALDDRIRRLGDDSIAGAAWTAEEVRHMLEALRLLDVMTPAPTGPSELSLRVADFLVAVEDLDEGGKVRLSEALDTLGLLGKFNDLDRARA